MTTAVLDTNVLVQAVISSAQSASQRVLRAYRDNRFSLVFSAETIDELSEVLGLPKIRARHGWSYDEIDEYLVSLLVNSLVYDVSVHVPPSITRDVTDTKFLELAHASRADFLVTNDRRHLLPLSRFGLTKIVTPTQLLRELA